MMNNKFDDLTEQQKENMVEFAAVSAHCKGDALTSTDRMS